MNKATEDSAHYIHLYETLEERDFCSLQYSLTF